MGIKRLFPLIESNGGAANRKKLNEYKGRTLAVDVSLYTYRYVKAAYGNTNGAAAHLIGFKSMIEKLDSHGIKPV